MATTTYENYTTGDNNTTKIFSYSFDVIKKEDVKVSLNGVTQTSGYSVTTTPAQVEFDSAPGDQVKIRIYRATEVDTPADLRYTFQAGSAIRAKDLNDMYEHSLFGLQERLDQPITKEDLDADCVTASEIADDAITNVHVKSDAAIAGSKINPAFGSQAVSTSGTVATGALTTTGNIAVSGTVDGRDVAADGTKLDGIEANAKDDQTAAEIRTLVESASDSNVFTDADHTKLNGIEASATADQTGAEIKSAYEGESNTNAYTDAEKTKLAGIATSADVTSTKNLADLANVHNATPSDGHVLKWINANSRWEPAADAGAGGANVADNDYGEITVASSGSSWTVDDNVIDEANLKISNAGSNGQYLQKQSGNTGGLTWADVTAFSTITEDTTGGADDGDITFSSSKTGGTGDNIVWDESEATWTMGEETLFKVGNARIFEVDDAGETWDGTACFGSATANRDVYIKSLDAVRIGTNPNNNNDHVAYFNCPVAGGFDNGYVKLYYTPYNGSPSNRIETTSTGTTLSKDVFFDNQENAGKDLLWDESDNALEFVDDVKAVFGTGGDLELYHNATDSYIDNDTGNLYIRTNVASDVGGDIYIRPHDDEEGIKIIHDAGVEIYHNGNKKLETTDTGATVTGTLAATALTGDGSALTGIAAGPTGTGNDAIFLNYGQSVTATYNIPANTNALTAGPVEITGGSTEVVIPSTSNWTIV